jgi:hypothetical protein
MNIKTLLEVEIENEFDKLSRLEPGSEEHEKTLNGLAKLMDRAIEIEKTESDCEEKIAARESDEVFKQQQLEVDKKDRLLRNIISGASVILPLLVTIWGTKVSLKFEEEGTFTTIMGRGFINKLLPKK